MKPIERRRWDDPEVDDFLQRGEPLILTDGCPLVARLVGRWTFDHLANNCFDGSEALQVHFAPTHAESGGSKSTAVFARIYGDGLGEGGVRLMSFSEFVATVAEWGPCAQWRHYLAAPLLASGRWRGEDRGREHASGSQYAPDDDTCSLLDDDDVDGAHGSRHPGTHESTASALPAPAYYTGPLERELADFIDWKWLARAQARGCDAAPFDMCQLWAGCGSGATPLHFDALSNFFAQVAGRKRVRLYPPTMTWRLYPYPVGVRSHGGFSSRRSAWRPCHKFCMHRSSLPGATRQHKPHRTRPSRAPWRPLPPQHPQDNFAMASPDAAEHADRFRALPDARGLEATMQPGEVLFLPRYYWHLITIEEDGEEPSPAHNLSLNFWGGRKGTGDFKKELWRAASRLPDASVVAAAALDAAAAAAAAARASAARDGGEDARLLEEGADDALAIRAYLASRHLEGSCTALLGEEAGRFLTALAAGEDASWDSSEGVKGRHANRVRAELIALLSAEGDGRGGFEYGEAGASSTLDSGRQATFDDGCRTQLSLGVRRANALLRAMTRDGRLHPGLAPPVTGEVISSEEGQLTPAGEYARLVCDSDGARLT